MSRRLAAFLLAALLLAGCGGAFRLEFPEDSAVAGWARGGQSQTLTGAALSGAAPALPDAGGQYQIESVERQKYTKSSGEQIEVQVWRMTAPAEAYGLWTALRSGKRVDGLGNGADSDGVRRLGFWQERCFVQVLAGQDVTAAELEAFGAALAKALPTGGEVPTLVRDLPQEGQEPDSVIYFHNEASIAKALDLVGQNILGLSFQTNGVLAGYRLDGQPYQLLLVEYVDERQAAAQLSVLQNAGLAGLLVSGSKGKRLGAVFGKESSGAVVKLLGEVLK